jgi:V8-like Glu-specific endopeptidase
MAHLVLLGLALATPLLAEGTVRPLSAVEAARWLGVGVLYVNGKSVCSAELISATEATTAAHCVYDRRTGVHTPASGMRLVFGPRNGGLAAVRGVRAAAVLPGFTAPGPRTALNTMPWDIALLALDAPVMPQTVRPFHLVDWPDPNGSSVDIVGYERPMPDHPRIRQGCRVAESSMGVAAATCAVVAGLSGAPVVLSFDTSAPPLLVAEVSSSGTAQGGQGLAFVVTIAPHLATLRALIGR